MIPYGYIEINGKIMLNPTTAPKIKKLYEAYAAGHILVKTAARKARIPRKEDGDEKGFTNGQIRYMLQNERYKGENGYPAIVTSELFEAVKQKRATRDKIVAGRKPHKRVPTFQPLSSFTLATPVDDSPQGLFDAIRASPTPTPTCE